MVRIPPIVLEKKMLKHDKLRITTDPNITGELRLKFFSTKDAQGLNPFWVRIVLISRQSSKAKHPLIGT